MGIVDHIQEKFAEKLVNRIVDQKQIIVTASFDTKNPKNLDIANAPKKDILAAIVDEKRLNLTIKFEDK